MTHLQAIESELSLCVDELNVLQSEGVVEQMFYSYVEKLMKVSIQLQSLLINVGTDPDPEVNKLRYFVFVICNLICGATNTLQKLKINTDDGWTRVFQELKFVSYTSNVMSLAPGKIGAISKVLATGTTIQNERQFMVVSSRARDTRMCSILKKISTALSALNTSAGGTYFDFLGGKGSNDMLMIIDHLA